MLRDTSAASTSKRSTSAARAAGVNKTTPTRNKARTTRQRTTWRGTIWRRWVAAFIVAASSAISAKTRPQRPTRRCAFSWRPYDCSGTRSRPEFRPRRTFDPKLRVIGLGERFGQGQPKLGFARAGLRPGVDVGKRLKRSGDLFFAHAGAGVASAQGRFAGVGKHCRDDDLATGTGKLDRV